MPNKKFSFNKRRFLCSVNIVFLTLFILTSCQSTNPNVNNLKPKESFPQKQSKDPNPEALQFFMNGQILLNQGQFAEAILEFQDALALDPNVATIYSALAESYWNIGKPELSMKNLKKALELDPEDEDALKMMADQLIMQKKYSEAVEPYTILRKNNPLETQYIIALAELKKVNRDFLAAMKLYLEAFELEPARYELLEAAGRNALQLKNKDEARAIFKKLSEQDPNELSYINIYSELALQSEKYNEAISHLKKLNDKHGKSIDRDAKLGILLFESGKTEEGRAALENLYESSQLSLQYIFSLFEMYLDTNEIQKAGILGDKLIADYPEDWRGYYSRALVFMNENEFSSAISILAPVSDIFTKKFSIQYMLGLNYSRIKKFKEALEYYNRALSLQPESAGVLHSMAIAYDEIGEWNKSDKIYLQLIEKNNLDAQALNNFAYSLVEREKDLDKALQYAKKAIELEPDNPSYLDTIGWVYFKLNDLRKAKKFIEKSIMIQGDNSVVLEHLGDILMKSNDRANASVYYKKAYEYDKENSSLRKKAYPEN